MATKVKTIRSIIDELGRATVRLGGRDVDIRALSSLETERIYNDLYPVPQPPKIKDPNGGSANRLPDPDNPEYLLERKRHDAFTATLMVAIAMELTDADGVGWNPSEADDVLREWCVRVVDDVRSAVSQLQLGDAHRQLLDLMDGNEVDMQRALIVEIPEGAEGEQGSAEDLKLPDRYGLSDLSVFLRICERFAMDPFEAIRRDSPPQLWRLLATHETVRQREEAARRVAGGAPCCE